jgi:AraC-like DNA-binding protein
MKFKIVSPSGFLRKYIKYYCFMDSDTHDGDVTERVIPTENIQLMFHYKNPFVVYNKTGSATRQPRSIVSGLSNTFSDVSTFGDAGVVFVLFHPAGACHFFEFPLVHIENKSINLSDIFTTEISQVEDDLFLERSIAGKILVIEKFLTKKFSPIPSYDDLIIQNGVDYIRHCKGQINAGILSDKLSTTSKTLERKFSRYLGKTPKQVIKLIRFQKVITDLSTIQYSNLTEYAYRNGYFDQAHFIKDFKEYSGYTPKEFIAKYSSHGSAIDI